MPPQDIGQRLETFWLSQCGEGCYWHQWAEVRDAAKHPTVQRTVCHNRGLSGSHCAKVKKPCSQLPLKTESRAMEEGLRWLRVSQGQLPAAVLQSHTDEQRDPECCKLADHQSPLPMSRLQCSQFPARLKRPGKTLFSPLEKQGCRSLEICTRGEPSLSV